MDMEDGQELSEKIQNFMSYIKIFNENQKMMMKTLKNSFQDLTNDPR